MSIQSLEPRVSLAGQTALITGSSGLGYEIARGLAARGARVIVAARDQRKAEAAMARIRAECPAAELQFEALDLASLASVDAFCARLSASQSGLDLLIANAGVMAPPVRTLTEDGLELQFQVNHLGHFALTLGLLPLLRRSGLARVVAVSSLAAAGARIDFDNLQGERRYRPLQAYARSKLANLLFIRELQRRSQTEGWGIVSLAVHPGIAHTDLFANGPGRGSWLAALHRHAGFLFQPADLAAGPVLFAATAPVVEAGGYYGPGGLFQWRGPTRRVALPRSLGGPELATRFWQHSEALLAARKP